MGVPTTPSPFLPLNDGPSSGRCRDESAFPRDRGPAPPRCPTETLRDGLYVACAETVGAPLLTLDGRLARCAPVPVEFP